MIRRADLGLRSLGGVPGPAHHRCDALVETGGEPDGPVGDGGEWVRRGWDSITLAVGCVHL